MMPIEELKQLVEVEKLRREALGLKICPDCGALIEIQPEPAWHGGGGQWEPHPDTYTCLNGHEHQISY